MARLLLHSEAERRIKALQANPPQSLLLYGEPGVGLLEIAKTIAGHTPLIIEPEGETQTLSIKTERVRQLYEETKNTSDQYRFVIIDEADAMTHAAQSAFLKLLEEPNQHTYFILTTHDKEKLLPTVRSRVQSHYLPLPTTEQITRLVRSLSDDPATRQKIIFLASRHPSRVYSYINDPALFKNDSQTMSDARVCVTTRSRYDRQIIALTHASSRNHAVVFLDACLHILQFALKKSGDPLAIARIESYLNAREQIEHNGNTKLVLTHLMV